MLKNLVPKSFLIVSGICLGLIGDAVALDKEKSLVTQKPLGEMAVAGRLSIDLHAKFMLSRSYHSETALNWYNCGYSGGGAGGTKVGGTFGYFGFQVPFAERELRYPKAVTINQVEAVHFDGDDFLKGNFPIERKILESGSMAIELWIRSEASSTGDLVLGWQSIDGKDTSAPLVLPPGFKGSTHWRHLVVNCKPQLESWYLDGLKIAEIPRRMIVLEGHVLVLGGANASKLSFQGELAAVRLHDEAMSEAEISHNFKGGVNLGTEMHHWWRDDPDKWWIQDSAHFRHAVDREEMKGWSEPQLAAFNQRVPEMFELAELAYHCYSERLALRSSAVSILPEERGDGIKYKTPIQPAQGNWMGFDGHFGWACQEAGFINPHELVHGWQAMTGGMAGNYWEAHANFPQTYIGVYQTIPVIMLESSAFPASGRTYYHDRLMFEHLSQTPEYGPMFISKLWYDGPTAKEDSPYPWITFDRINPYADRNLAEEYTRMAMRNITWDYQNFKEFKPGGHNRDLQPSTENLYRKTAESYRTDRQQSLLRSRVILQRIPYEPAWWRVPKQQAPQQLGWNLCPLKFTPGKVTARLQGYIDEKRGGDWRAAFVGVDVAGKPIYGKIQPPGKPLEFQASPELKELYLVVCATPSKIMDIPMTGDFRSFEQEQFPYKVSLEGCEPLDILADERLEVSGKPHPNGGGLVEASAEVEASVFVGPDARVLGSSKVSGNARIEDFAVVSDATVKDHAVVSGHSMVFDHSTVSGQAKVRDYAVVKGNTTVTGDAKVLEHAVMDTQKTCSGQVVVKGIASVYGGNQSGSAMIDGFYAKGNEITKGKWFTWSWGQGINPGEVDESFGCLYADYDFNEAHGWMARDTFGGTWSYLVNGPSFAFREDSQANKPADGVLKLNGKDQFVELPNDVADMSNCTYTMEVMWEGGEDGSRLFEFAAANGDLLALTPSAQGRMILTLRQKDLVESISAPALQPGEWNKVQLMFDGDLASIYINDIKAAEKTGIQLRPESIRATRCYLGRGVRGNFLKGSIGRFTIHSAALIDRVPPSPNPASFVRPPMFTSPGALVMTATRGFDPLGDVEYWFEEKDSRWNSGWTRKRTVQLDLQSGTGSRQFRTKMRDSCGNETAFSPFSVAGGFPKSTAIHEISPGEPTVIEAEQFFDSTPALDGITSWEKGSDLSGFAGEGYMSIPDRGLVNAPFSAAAARLDYAVRFTRPGRYFLWIRGNGNNDGGVTVNAGFDIKASDWGTQLRTGHGRYAWHRSPSFQVAKAGNYLFSIWMHEDGAILDRLLFTSSVSYEPSPTERASDKVMIGLGPPTTPSRATD